MKSKENDKHLNHQQLSLGALTPTSKETSSKNKLQKRYTMLSVVLVCIMTLALACLAVSTFGSSDVLADRGGEESSVDYISTETTISDSSKDESFIEESKHVSEVSVESESTDTLPVQVDWSEWLDEDEVPEFVNAADYEIEEQTLYRSRELETTTSTKKSLDGWTYVKKEKADGGYGNWSAWTTDKISETEDNQVESETRYRFRDKKYKTSDTELDDWNLYDTTYDELGEWGPWSDWKVAESPQELIFGDACYDGQVVEQYRYRDITVSQEYTDWSGWSDWSSTKQSASDNKKVETRTVWGYYFFLCPNCGSHMHLSTKCYTWAGGCGKSNINNWNERWSTTSWSSAGLKDWKGTGKLYTYLNGELVFKWDDGNGNARTQYRYATRSLQDVYNYSPWSDWSSDYVSSSSTREVETRTIYRVRERDYVPTYHYWKWESWSDWSDDKPTEKSDREIDSTKFYRSREKLTETTYFFERWSDWSDYSTTKVKASDGVEVKTKKQYRYKPK